MMHPCIYPYMCVPCIPCGSVHNPPPASPQLIRCWVPKIDFKKAPTQPLFVPASANTVTCPYLCSVGQSCSVAHTCQHQHSPGQCQLDAVYFFQNIYPQLNLSGTWSGSGSGFGYASEYWPPIYLKGHQCSPCATPGHT
uniref:Uncharacterized protein n=1 Tax=Eutreptiella gymnastica TaxID=73025 RepID=A0A7S1INU0_9EUGL|mmetsp:Transcript_32115/g.57604  ORF Transcript_32115/g.57604 Transcript_32115/m.57604 type:complete len:139 (+) Transcript_32115:360-776(+)